MRIDVEKLAASGIALRWDEQRSIELGPSGAVTGLYESTPEAIRIRASASHALTVHGFRWPIGGAVVSAIAPARAEQARVDLQIGRAERPSTGVVSAGKLRAGALEIALAAIAEPVLCEGISADGLRVELGEQGPLLEAQRVLIERLKIPLASVAIVADGIELGGVRVRGRCIDVKSVRVTTVSLELPSLALVLPKRGGARKRSGAGVDLALLDHLNGKLDVDLTVDATVPVIGRRRATHHFRVPIADGSLDYKKLERNLSALEDAVLDFEVRGNKLCLEKDIPLVPFDRKALVEWRLDPSEVELAHKRRVRLRRLAQPHVRQSSGGDGGFAVRSLHFDGLALDLKLRGPVDLALGEVALTLGDDERPALGGVELRGAVHYDASGRPAATELALELRKLRLAVARLPLRLPGTGDASLELAAVTLGGASAKAALRGLEPGALRGTLRDLALEGVRFG